MEMIERYLEAVGFWLPRKQKDDILAELSEDIHAQIEEREAAVSHSLTEPEVEAILKKRGSPVVVANGFLPQKQLIGPLVFPIFSFVMKIVCFGYLLPWALALTGVSIYVHLYADGQTRAAHLAAVASAWSTWWSAGFASIALTTLSFAIVERVQTKSRFLDMWDIRKLPPVRVPNRIPRVNSAFEIAFMMLFFVWWAFHASSRIVHLGSAFQVELGPQWTWCFCIWLLLTVVNGAVSIANLLHPYWTVTRATLRLLTDFTGAAVWCWLVRVNIVTGISSPSLDAEQSLQIVHKVNYWLNWSFPWAVVVLLILAGVDVYRIIRVNRRGPSTP